MLCILNVGTVPTLYILNVGTVPTLCILDVGTVPMFSSSHNYMETRLITMRSKPDYIEFVLL